MSESVSVTIIEKEGWSYISPTRYDVVIKATPEFLREPKHVLSDEQKAEYISHRIKEEFYKKLTTTIERGQELTPLDDSENYSLITIDLMIKRLQMIKNNIKKKKFKIGKTTWEGFKVLYENHDAKHIDRFFSNH